ncbi:hypothetical protein EZV62_001627 [Acer yangbiense]|uniref:Retrotransposon Copia-like N-terminal domain-containing protein n=1 Tax=Acer yangbiense TaxID=1000413 RepID=A0A5C7IVE1_9ROSI|nr:hypothetical protein EZV62_001627 [Acer yangbiense]
MVSEKETTTFTSPFVAMNVSQSSSNITKLLMSLKLELTVKLNLTIIPPNKLNVDGSVNENFLDWEQQDQVLLCWILSSISQEILPKLVGCSTSCEAWKTIEKRFKSQSKANVMQLNISEYIMKKKCVFDALSHTGYGISEEDKIMYVLSGIGPEYDPFVIPVTSMPNSYSLPEITALLLTHKTRIDQHSSVKEVNVNMVVNKKSIGGNQTGYQTGYGIHGYVF